MVVAVVVVVPCADRRGSSIGSVSVLQVVESGGELWFGWGLAGGREVLRRGRFG